MPPLTLPPPDTIIDTDGCLARIYTVLNSPPAEGCPKGGVVILLHGNHGTGAVFAPLLPLLTGRPHRQCDTDIPVCVHYIIPELPWHTTSPRWASFLDDPRTAAAYCLHIADLLGIPRFDFVGHSLGGMIGLTLALDHPDRIASLALLDAHVKLGERPHALNRLAPFDPSRHDHAEAIAQNMGGPAVNWHLAFDLSARARTIRCPVLELIGESTPDTADLFDAWRQEHRADYPPTWRIQRIPRGGHFFPLEQPALTAAALHRFWGDNG